MGSFVELNDTLQITTEQGFPAELLDVKKHQEKAIALAELEGRVFVFKDKKGARIYHPAHTRVFLVHNLEGKWIHWGTIEMLEQTISWNGKEHFTSGKYRITKIFDPKAQKEITKNDSPKGQSYF